MEKYQQEFIDFMVRSGVLTFGDFTTKSGRKTPFFINTGNYKTGRQMKDLGGFYAQAILASKAFVYSEAHVKALYGPAYKGIPLVVATAIAACDYRVDIPFCFNRKEVKDHGEGGNLIGYKPKDGDSILIIEDVVTAGTSVRESVALLQSVAKVSIAGVIVSVDRMERGANSEKSAIQEIGQEFGIPVEAIVNLDDIVLYLTTTPVDGRIVIDEKMAESIAAYRALYGAKY